MIRIPTVPASPRRWSVLAWTPGIFITADYAFGWQLEQDASTAVERAGGRVIGHSRHPLNANSFLEHLDAAQDSGAKVIALANAGGDTINAVRQAAEIGISPRSQTLVPLLVFISDVHTLGLDVAKGMTFIDGFYWNADDAVRARGRNGFLTGTRSCRRWRMPASTPPSSTICAPFVWLAPRRAGPSLPKCASSGSMTSSPKVGGLRADGRLVHAMYLVEVKAPRGSRG